MELGWAVTFLALDRLTYICNMNLLLGLEPLKKLVMVVAVVVKRHFRVSLWSKPWTCDLMLGSS